MSAMRKPFVPPHEGSGVRRRCVVIHAVVAVTGDVTAMRQHPASSAAVGRGERRGALGSEGHWNDLRKVLRAPTMAGEGSPTLRLKLIWL